MKLQVSFEQLISLSLFIFSVIFLINQLISYYLIYINKIEKQTLLLEAYQVSELLVNDVGQPANWNINNVRRIGLLSENLNKTNVLSYLKVSSAIELCRRSNSDYVKFKNLLDLKRDINIVVYSEGRLIGNCSRPMKENAVKISRIISFNDGKYGELILWLY
jgi:hypothetical protein